MKIIIAWMTTAPGKREEFLTTVQPWLIGTRQEAGCAFLELTPSRDNVDVSVLTEAFQDEASHEAHSKLPHQIWMQEQIARYVVHGRFEIFYADRHNSHTMGKPAE